MLQFFSRFWTPTVVVDGTIVQCDDLYADADHILGFEPFLHWLHRHKTAEATNIQVLRFRVKEKTMLIRYELAGEMSILTLREPQKLVLLWCKCEDKIYVLSYKLPSAKGALLRAPTLGDIDGIDDLFYSKDGLVLIGDIETPSDRCLLFAHHSPSILATKSALVQVDALDATPIQDSRMAALVVLATRQEPVLLNNAD